MLYRWLNFFWIVGVFSWELYAHNVAPSSDSNAPVAHPVVGYILLGLAFIVTAGLTELYQRDPDLLLRPLAAVVEVAVASVMLFADEWVYGFAEHAQSLPSMWVIAAVIAVAIAGVSEVLGIFCGKILPGVCNATVRSYCCTAMKYSTSQQYSSSYVQ